MLSLLVAGQDPVPGVVVGAYLPGSFNVHVPSAVRAKLVAY